jgi:Dolichyl-phosphate-mannose-protein mannosyltransferase
MTISAASMLPAVSRFRRARLVHALAVACTIVAGMALSAHFVLSALSSVGLAWPVTHPEGATIAAILRARDGEALYQNFHRFPHLITPYPPLQPAGVGLASRLLGLSILETIGLARCLTLAASLAATLLIWLVARRLGAGRLSALAGASMFLPLPFLDEWGFAARPDVPAVALSLLAMLLLIARPKQPWLAAAIAVVALFTKQTAVALPVAATLWLLFSRRWQAAAIFVGTGVGLTAAAVALLEVATERHYILNTVLAHLNTPKNGFDLAVRDFVPYLQDAWLPIGLTVAAVLLPGVRGQAALPILYVGTSAGLALYSLRNTGGDVNYLIEPAAAACIPAALAIDWLWRRPAPNLLAVSGSVLLAGATVVWAAGLWDFWRLDGGVDPTSRLPIAEIAAAETVLSEEPLAVLLAGRPLVVSDTFHLSMLTTSGFFDPLDLERRIKRSEFDLIVMRSDIRAARWWKRQLLLPETVRLAIKDTYVPAGRVGMFWLYRPEERRPASR